MWSLFLVTLYAKQYLDNSKIKWVTYSFKVYIIFQIPESLHTGQTWIWCVSTDCILGNFT